MPTGRAGVGDGSGGVLDLGHSLLTPLYDWKNASPLAAQVGVTLNSLLILLAACFGAIEAFVHGRPRAIVVCIPAGMMRMTVGVFTRMPEPEGYVPTPGDWPPPSDDVLIFVCGPPAMYDLLSGPRTDKALTGLLAEMGYSARHVVKF